MTRMKVLSTAEAARRSGFSSRTIARWCREQAVPATKVGRVWRINEATFHLFIGAKR